MNPTGNLMVKISGSPELVADLESVVKQNPADMELKSVGPAEEPSHLGLGFVEVATIIAFVNGALGLAKFAYAIYKYLSGQPRQRVIIQTPLRTIEISSSDAISEDRVRELVSCALKT